MGGPRSPIDPNIGVMVNETRCSRGGSKPVLDEVNGTRSSRPAHGAHTFEDLLKESCAQPPRALTREKALPAQGTPGRQHLGHTLLHHQALPEAAQCSVAESGQQARSPSRWSPEQEAPDRSL